MSHDFVVFISSSKHVLFVPPDMRKYIVNDVTERLLHNVEQTIVC